MKDLISNMCDVYLNKNFITILNLLSVTVFHEYAMADLVYIYNRCHAAMINKDTLKCVELTRPSSLDSARELLTSNKYLKQ